MRLTLLRFAIAALLVIGSTVGANAQVYFHNFGTTSITGKPYTVAPVTFATGLSSSSWNTNATAFTSFAGNGGSPSQALSLGASNSNTYTLTFTVDAGSTLDITAFNFWRQRSTSGPANWAMTINGTSVGSGTTPTSGSFIGSTSVSGFTGLTGTVTIVLSLTGGSGGTFRLDDFTLTGTVNTGACTTPGDPTSSDVSTCAGSTATITGTGPTSGAAYTYWTAATGGSAITGSTTPPGTASGNNLTVPGTLTAGTYDYYVQAESGSCLSANRKKVTVTVNAAPANPGNPVAAANPACTSTTLNTMTPAAGTTNYWQGTNSTGTSTAQNTSATYNVSSTNTYYVRAQNNTTLCWSTAGSVSVTINSVPGQPSSVVQNPSGSICMGNSYTFSVTNTAGVTYNWALPSGWTQTGGGTTNSITVTAGSTVANITVTPSNSCGNGTARGYNISSVGTPAVINTQPTDITVCSDATATISAGVTGASSYQWQFSTNLSTWLSASNGTYGVSGATTSTISLANPITNEWYGYYFRLIANGAGCGATYSDTVEVKGGNPTITLPGTPATLLSENFGTTTTSTLPTGFTTYGIPSSSTVFTLNTAAHSGGEYTGASGGANALLVGNSGNAGKRIYLETPTINTTGKGNITVIWGVRQSSSYSGTQLIEYSTDGSTWTAVPYVYTAQYYGDNWNLENGDVPIQLPADASNITTLKLRISTPVHATGTFRIDDILVEGIDIATPAVSVCSGSSFNLPYTDVSVDADKYSVSVTPAIAGFSVVDANLPASPISINVPSAATTGDYTFKVSVKNSATGCTSFAEQVYVVHVNKPTFTTSQSNLACYGIGVGTVTITPTSGVSPFLYTINNFFSTQALGVYGAVAPGSLTVGIEDADGCRSDVATVTITQPTQIVPTAGNGGPYTAGQTINLTSSATGGTGTLTYAWSGPQTYTANTANASRSNAQTSHAGTYTVTVTDANSCTATANTNVVVNPGAVSTYTWTGNISTDWDTPGNWDVNQVPNGCSHNVIIPATPGTPTPSGNFPAIDVIVSVGNIQLGNNSRITLDANLNVCGNWTGANGTAAVMLGNGSVVLQGSALQTLSGKTQFNTLRLNNSAGAQIQSGSALEVFTALELQSGTLAAGTNLLTFRSISANEIAILDNFSSGFTGTVTGSIRAQRYYDNPAAQSFSQHFMGSPVNAPAVSQFGAAGVPGVVQPLNCWIDSFASGSPYGSMYEYIEANGATCGVQVWNSVTSGTAVNGKGYSVARSGAGTLTVNGTPNLNSSYAVSGLTNSNYSNTAQYVQSGPATSVTINSGWNLVANPYLATLNVTTHAANSAFDAQIQVWHATGAFAGTYQPRITNSNATLAPFQAFLVRKTATGGTATYNLYASDRTTAQATFYRQANQSELKITAENTTTGLLDETYVAFNTDASTQFDSEYDANKVQGTNTRHTIYTVAGSDDYAINTLNDVAQTSTVPMHMRPGGNSTFKFTVDGINTFDPTQYIYLEDKVTGQMIDLRQNPEYTFSMTTAEAFDRFVLHFTPAATFAANDATCEAQGQINITQPGTANWNYTVTDANNATISSGTLNQANPVTVNAATGVYTVTLIDANNYTVARNVQVSGANAADATFTPSATTVEEGEDVVLQANQGGNSTYTWNLGNGTTATGSGVTFAYNTPGVYTVELTVTNAGGCTATSTQIITVNAKVETGIKDVTDGSIKLWSNKNKVYVDFSKLKTDNATVGIYNLIGQELSKEKFNGTLYIKEVTQLEAGYVLVRVENNGNITTKKLLITNK